LSNFNEYTSCAELGCAVQDWLRIGWGGEPPLPLGKKILKHSLASPHWMGDATLQCQEMNSPTFKQIARPDDGSDDNFACGLGARKLRVQQGDAWYSHSLYSDSLDMYSDYPAMARFLDNSESEDETVRNLLSGNIDIWGIVPFDTEGKILHRSVPLRVLGRALGPDGPDLIQELQSSSVLPVVTPPGKPMSDLLFRHGSLLILPQGNPSVMYEESSDTYIAAAVMDTKSVLHLLAKEGDVLSGNLMSVSGAEAHSIQKSHSFGRGKRRTDGADLCSFKRRSAL
jgi:hypothetical protein